MRQILTLAVLLVGGIALAGDQTVVVPADNKPFVVDQTDIVRLTEKGIAGSKIEANVVGPAKIDATNSIRQLVNGQPIIGNSIKEFDLKPTGLGKVTVKLTVTPPNAQARVTTFEFEVR